MENYLRQLWARLLAALDHTPASNATHSVLEQFAIPHTFGPNLTFFEALIAVAAALCRIFLGCLTFALWGVCIWTTWDTIPNIVLRILAILPQIVLFLLSLAVLELAINTILKKLWPKQA